MSQVLMMSNDPVLRKKNLDVLVGSGFQVTDVADGLDGLLMVDKNGFEVIIIDEELSDIDGYRACQKMRQYSDIPIILLGSEQSEDVWAKVEELGFDIYLKKPVSPRELVAHVKSLLRRSSPEGKVRPERKEKTAEILSTPSAAPPPPVSTQSTDGVMKDQPFQKRRFADPQSIPVIPMPKEQPSVVNKVSEAERIFQDVGTARKQVIEDVVKPQMKAPIQFAETVGSDSPFQERQQQQTRAIPIIPAPIRESESQYERQPAGMRQSIPVTPIQDWVTERQGVKPVSFDSKNVSVAPFQETGSVYLESVTRPAGSNLSSATTTYEIWKDSRVVKLMEAMASRRLDEIKPEINVSLKGGFAFPEADRIMETTGEQTKNILDALANEAILERKPFEKISVDPEGSYQLVPVERCPKCGAGNLSRGQLIEHFFCGNVGLDQDYKSEHKYICPKCNRELKLLGTDYRNAGLQYRCIECSEIFPAPLVKWRNLQTGKLWTQEELTTIQLYSYRLMENRRDWLEFQLKPKAQLIELLKIRGFHVEESAQVHGSSGAIHTIDILASKDDGLAKLFLGIGILTSKPGETEVSLDELFKFDTKAYDMGLNYKVVIVIPRLSQEAMKFAERQKIGVFEARDPDTLMSFLENKSRLAAPVLTREKIRYLMAEVGAAGPKAGPYPKLIAFLKGQGYNVVENAKVIGKSGAEHIFDIFAQRDDVVIKPAVAIAVSYAEDGKEVDISKVSQFDAEVFDAGIRNKILVAVPQLSSQGKQFAKQQRIKVLDEFELDGLLHSLAAI